MSAGLQKFAAGDCNIYFGNVLEDVNKIFARHMHTFTGLECCVCLWVYWNTLSCILIEMNTSILQGHIKLIKDYSKGSCNVTKYVYF